MKILLNGETRDVLDALSLQGLIDQLDLQGGRFAVEINEEVVPRSLYPMRVLEEGDRVEIVQAIGGG